MNDYIMQLEKQNEELQKKLADAELMNIWHNYRISNRLYFTYDIMFAEHDKFVEWRGMPRLRVRDIMGNIRNLPWKEAIKTFTQDQSVNKFQIHIQAWRNFFNTNRVYVTGKTIAIEHQEIEFNP